MSKPVFTTERCKGCALCTRACPQKLLVLSASFNSKGYRPATCIDEAKCTGCTLCARTCPDLVIQIHK